MIGAYRGLVFTFNCSWPPKGIATKSGAVLHLLSITVHSLRKPAPAQPHLLFLWLYLVAYLACTKLVIVFAKAPVIEPSFILHLVHHFLPQEQQRHDLLLLSRARCPPRFDLRKHDLLNLIARWGLA